VIQFFKEIYNKEKISSHYKEEIDETDFAFFEAFAQDFGQIAHAYNMKRQKLGEQ
jgi:hypothetical protein